MRTAALLVAVVVALVAQRDHVERPVFLRTHGVYSARSEMFLQVRIVPHRDIRTVILEAWELEGEPQEPAENDILSDWLLPLDAKVIGLARSSVEDAEPDRAIYGFRWRAGLDRGDYRLVSKVYLGRGLHVESQPKIVLVR